MSIQHFSSSQHNQKTREKNSIPHGHNHTLPRPKKKPQPISSLPRRTSRSSGNFSRLQSSLPQHHLSPTHGWENTNLQPWSVASLSHFSRPPNQSLPEPTHPPCVPFPVYLPPQAAIIFPITAKPTCDSHAKTNQPPSSHNQNTSTGTKIAPPPSLSTPSHSQNHQTSFLSIRLAHQLTFIIDQWPSFSNYTTIV
jgi:hypothetical protein